MFIAHLVELMIMLIIIQLKICINSWNLSKQNKLNYNHQNRLNKKLKIKESYQMIVSVK